MQSQELILFLTLTTLKVMNASVSSNALCDSYIYGDTKGRRIVKQWGTLKTPVPHWLGYPVISVVNSSKQFIVSLSQGRLAYLYVINKKGINALVFINFK